MFLILGALGAYLIGSIPTAYIFGKVLKGIDIRQHGSGNVGATNVFRTLGKGPGFAVLFLDIIKGIVPVVFLADLLSLHTPTERIVLALCAVCGHNWTIFLQFKGGKGIATSLGVLIGFTISVPEVRPVLFWVLLIWLVFFLSTSIVSIASIIAAICLPILMILTGQSFEIIGLGVIFSIFVTIRHKTNIRRLLDGTENRVPLPWNKKS